MSGTFHLVHLLGQCSEAVNQDLQPALQPVETDFHVGVALLQLAHLLALLLGRTHGDELGQLGAEELLLLLHALDALLHVQRVLLQHAQTLIEGVHVEPEKVLEAGVAALQTGGEARREPGHRSVGAKRDVSCRWGNGGGKINSGGGRQQSPSRDGCSRRSRENVAAVVVVVVVIIAVVIVVVPAAVQIDLFLPAEIEHGLGAAAGGQEALKRLLQEKVTAAVRRRLLFSSCQNSKNQAEIPKTVES